jgi:hypothetical protein
MAAYGNPQIRPDRDADSLPAGKFAGDLSKPRVCEGNSHCNSTVLRRPPCTLAGNFLVMQEGVHSLRQGTFCWRQGVASLGCRFVPGLNPKSVQRADRVLMFASGQLAENSQGLLPGGSGWAKSTLPEGRRPRDVGWERLQSVFIFVRSSS